MVKKAERASLGCKGKDRTSPRLHTANSRSYKEEKEDYLTMIESVTVMESQMLACNM